MGNPAKIEKRDVFNVRDLGHHMAEDSFNTKNYKSDVFIYNVLQETLDMDIIDNFKRFGC